jgi:hypothetical protein
MSILIAAQTGATQSNTIHINAERPSPVSEKQGSFPGGTTFRVTGGALGAGEYVKLQYHDGTGWRDATIEGNDAKILDENNAVVTVYGRMTSIRLSKSLTSSAIGVEVC